MSTPTTSHSDQITNLPGLSPDWQGVQFAGYSSIYGDANPLPLSGKDQGMFYWFVGTTDYASRPTLVWTNGGPGASSFWGFFLENGPFEVTKDASDPSGYKVTPRATGWNNKINFMILEHPMGVTYSQPSEPSLIPSSPSVGALETYQALANFMAAHPEILANPLVLAGESYAGTYLPLLASNILNPNVPGLQQQNLLLTVLMDAWVDPITQMKTDTDYAFAHGLISKEKKAYIDSHYISENQADANALNNIQPVINSLSGVYLTNIAQTNDPATDAVIAYLNSKEVKQVLGVPDSIPAFQWLSSDAVWQNYKPQVNNSYRYIVDEMLDANSNVMVISGLNDGKDCNFLGTGAWMELLSSSLGTEVVNMDPQVWLSDGSLVDSSLTKQWPPVPPHPYPIGYLQDGGMLSWLKVLNAGHMAALDQPQVIDQILRKAGL